LGFWCACLRNRRANYQKEHRLETGNSLTDSPIAFGEENPRTISDAEDIRGRPNISTTKRGREGVGNRSFGQHGLREKPKKKQESNWQKETEKCNSDLCQRIANKK